MMRYTVQYIPLSKIKPGISVRITQRMKELRRAARDCMHLLVVRKSRKEGGYIIVSGTSNYDYFKKHTRNKSAPCLVDESKASSSVGAIMNLLRRRKLPYDISFLNPDRLAPGSWSIMRSFIRQEPRFKQLSRSQQIKVLRLGLQYKKTTVSAMKAKVEAMLNK